MHPPPRKQAPQPPRPRAQPVAGPSRLGPLTARKQSTTGPVHRPPPAVVAPAVVHKSSYRSRDGAPAVPVSLNADIDVPVSRRSGITTMSARASGGAARKTAAVQRASPMGGRYYLRRGQLVRVSDSSDDDSDPGGHDAYARHYERDDLEDMYMTPPPPQPLVQAGRKSTAKVPFVPRKAARKVDVEVISISSDSTSEDEADTSITGLLHAFSAVSISTRLKNHARLPFLCRNVRRGFLYACRNAEVPTHPKTRPVVPLKVVYQYPTRQDAIVFHEVPTQWTEFVSKSEDWTCPLCNIHGIFNTFKMLKLHMQMDHQEAEIIWSFVDGQCQVTLRYDHRQRETAGLDDDILDDESEQEIEQEAEPLDPTIIRQETPEFEIPPAPLDGDNAAPEAPHHIEPKYEVTVHHFEDPLPQPLSPAAEVRQPRTGYTADGGLAPPPRDKPRGPAAEPPLESCRPGGPKIYDLLSELPLDEFGVLSWAIVDREDEIFEISDILDEDKVMMALWNRWIMLYRRDFLFNGYYNGVERFLDRYHPMIHRAAGLDALRSFLLVLAANKFLKMREVGQALRHYEGLVKMDEWYKDDPPPDGEGS